MRDEELIKKIHSAMYRQCQTRGYTAPVDVLMDIGILPKQKYEDWRFGRVPYLEGVCAANLHRLSFIMHQMRVYAEKTGLKPSFCYYKRWGVKKKNGQGRRPVIPLLFSKSGDPVLERRYATHYIESKRVEQLKVMASANRRVCPERSIIHWDSFLQTAYLFNAVEIPKGLR